MYKTLFAITLFSLSVKAGGSDIIYGGDEIIAAFKTIQMDLQRDLGKIPERIMPLTDFQRQYTEKASYTHITVSDHLFKENQEVGFLNYPMQKPPQIVISRNLWRCMDTNNEICRRLVLHEMMPIIGNDDRSYWNSNEVLSLINYFRNLNSITQLIKPVKEPTLLSLRHSLYWIVERLNDSNLLMPYVNIRKIKPTKDELSDLEWLQYYFLNNSNLQAEGYNNLFLAKQIEIYLKSF